ncbi:MAG: hypothetical protein HND42_00155 [Armatimonadetes bacterium]|nr:hypothetical protein [Armatimonadota bacterium]NOG91643.1 hypothetical protein [Armatimonadota bacterium]
MNTAHEEAQITVRAQGPEALYAILSRHHRVRLEDFEDAATPQIEFAVGTWHRRALFGHPRVEGPYGLIELMDNNPIVCADAASCPGPAATLALIGLGPLARASLLTLPASVELNFQKGAEEVPTALEMQGGSVDVRIETRLDAPVTVLTATCLAQIPEAISEADIHDVYSECYVRSFFVRRVSEERVTDGLLGAPYANYCLRVTEQGPQRAVEVKVAADPDGKAGSAQLVHLMNVMGGFEEGLGL